MKMKSVRSPLRTLSATLVLGLAATAVRSTAADPQLDSWFTSASGRYARVYLNAAAQSTGTAVTTWSNGSQTQSLPASSGVQEINASADWVYLRTTGLGIHTMGPWSVGFPNLPANPHVLYRLPRHPTVPASKTLTGFGSIGYFVDGVAMFDSRDAFYWNGSTETQGSGNWNREAYVNEGKTFDPAYAHQENSGTYHYHANPVALRYLLQDHVDYHADTRTYSESTGPVQKHSPILGWVRDGFPVYGPYGYANATNPASGLRRMISGYQLRNGQHGTDNLIATGRTQIPAWATRLYGNSGNATGPAVSASYPLGRYMEDNAYLGDFGQHLGTDFDLDEDNGRFCVTPEFPQGTYAYFVSIADDGTPTFPYNIGRAFHGNPTGAPVTTLTETVTNHYTGGAQAPVQLASPEVSGGKVTLVWSAVEGGTYQVETSSNLTTWSAQGAPVTATSNLAGTTNTSAGNPNFARILRTAVANHDSVTNSTTGGGTGGDPGGGGPTLSGISPVSGNRGTSVVVTLMLAANSQPPPPPAGVNPTSATLGAFPGTKLTRNGNNITASFAIPANAPTGPVTVSLVFPGPPGMGNVTFTLANGFTIL